MSHFNIFIVYFFYSILTDNINMTIFYNLKMYMIGLKV